MMKRKRTMKKHTMLLVVIALFALVIIGKNVLQATQQASISTPNDMSEGQVGEAQTSQDVSTRSNDAQIDHNEQIDNDETDGDHVTSSPSEGKRIEYFSKSQLETATGQSLTLLNVGKVEEAMHEASVWESLGFSTEDAKNIARRISTSSDQTRGILRGVSQKPNKRFKVVLLDNGHVNIGTGTNS